LGGDHVWRNIESIPVVPSHKSQTILYNRRDNKTKRTKIIASRTTADNRTSDHVHRDYEVDYVESLVPIF